MAILSFWYLYSHIIKFHGHCYFICTALMVVLAPVWISWFHSCGCLLYLYCADTSTRQNNETIWKYILLTEEKCSFWCWTYLKVLIVPLYADCYHLHFWVQSYQFAWIWERKMHQDQPTQKSGWVRQHIFLREGKDTKWMREKWAKSTEIDILLLWASMPRA